MKPETKRLVTSSVVAIVIFSSVLIIGMTGPPIFDVVSNTIGLQSSIPSYQALALLMAHIYPFAFNITLLDGTIQEPPDCDFVDIRDQFEENPKSLAPEHGIECNEALETQYTLFNKEGYPNITIFNTISISLPPNQPRDGSFVLALLILSFDTEHILLLPSNLQMIKGENINYVDNEEGLSSGIWLVQREVVTLFLSIPNTPGEYSLITDVSLSHGLLQASIIVS